MTQLSDVAAKVEAELQRRHKDIVLSVFRIMCKKHNELGKCNCEYCNTLPSYVSAKRRLQYLKRMDDAYWYRPAPEGLYIEDFYFVLDQQKRLVKELKREKDALKLLN